MDLIKKNIPIIVCVVIIVGAIVADFIPLGGFREELSGKAKASAGAWSEIERISNEKRTLPIVDPTITEAPPLEGFPTEAVIKAGEGATEQLAKASQALFDNVVGRTKREQLVQGVLPGPANAQDPRKFTLSESFKRAYQPVTDLFTPARANSLPARVMKAGFAPTVDDLNARRAEIVTRINNTVAVRVGDQITNQERVNERIAAETATLLDDMVREAASKYLVYITPESMEVNPAIASTAGQLDFGVIFWAQIGLWAQEDLYRGIRQVSDSAGAKDVASSPIKQLTKVDVISDVFVGVTAQAIDPNNPPPPLSTDPNAALTADYLKSPTGRVSNALFDVMHMQVTMIVEADKLPFVLNTLGRGRLLSVIQVLSVEPVDLIAETNTGYFYGDKPCVRVTVLVEDLLLRQATLEIMPEQVKVQLGISQPASPGT